MTAESWSRRPRNNVHCQVIPSNHVLMATKHAPATKILLLLLLSSFIIIWHTNSVLLYSYYYLVLVLILIFDLSHIMYNDSWMK